ncbi:hypothetical protein F5X96DRAFT_270964 [Biscogniauxia mediterranea]|nr:hypothetical protein F5X96DRAFT_270964 [Biscogniauxia mediterranea]
MYLSGICSTRVDVRTMDVLVVCCSFVSFLVLVCGRPLPPFSSLFSPPAWIALDSTRLRDLARRLRSQPPWLTTRLRVCVCVSLSRSVTYERMNHDEDVYLDLIFVFVFFVFVSSSCLPIVFGLGGRVSTYLG